MKSVYRVAMAAVTGATLLGCAVKPIAGSEQVRIVTPAQVEKLRSCKKLVPVEGYNDIRENSFKELRNKVVEAGGNVALSNIEPFLRIRGIAYRCPAETVRTLEDMSGL